MLRRHSEEETSRQWGRGSWKWGGGGDRLTNLLWSKTLMTTSGGSSRRWSCLPSTISWSNTKSSSHRGLNVCSKTLGTIKRKGQRQMSEGSPLSFQVGGQRDASLAVYHQRHGCPVLVSLCDHLHFPSTKVKPRKQWLSVLHQGLSQARALSSNLS